MEDVLFCRLCALKKDRLVGIYDDEGHKLNIETKINKCLQIEVSFTVRTSNNTLFKYINFIDVNRIMKLIWVYF